jgi:hypothetical protein
MERILRKSIIGYLLSHVVTPAFLLLCFAFAACSADAEYQEMKQTPGLTEDDNDMNDDVFKNAPLNSNEKAPCSPPEPEPTWRGIVIRAPQEVTFKTGDRVDEYGAFAVIPICGFHLMDVPAEPVEEPMVVVAVEKETGAKLIGPIVELDISPEIPPKIDDEPPSPEALEGVASGGYFNRNLANFVDLPQIPATYDVHIEWRGFKSNVVTIKLVEETEE